MCLLFPMFNKTGLLCSSYDWSLRNSPRLQVKETAPAMCSLVMIFITVKPSPRNIAKGRSILSVFDGR